MHNPARRMSRIIAALAMMYAFGASAQEVKHYRFAYDQPRNTGHSVAGDLFADKLKELSKGTMISISTPAPSSDRSRSFCSS